MSFLDSRDDCFAAPCALLVDRAGRDLLGLVLGAAALAQPFLDVLVLAFALGVPCLLRHPNLLRSYGRDLPRSRNLYSRGGFWTLCSVAYASVSWSTTFMPSL